MSEDWGASGVKYYCPMISIIDEGKTLLDGRQRGKITKTRQCVCVREVVGPIALTR